MTTPLTLDTARRGDGTMVLTVAGEIDLSNVANFDSAIRDAISDADGEAVTVDLGGVQYLDSGAINAPFHHASGISVVTNALLLPLLTISGLVEVVVVKQA
jgi:anti-anti-sigma factor